MNSLHNQILYSIFLIVLLPAIGLNAQQVEFTIDPALGNASLGRYIEILEDKTGDLTIQDVTSLEKAQTFSPSEAEEPGYGFTSSVYWARLTVINPSNVPIEWFLELGYPLIDFVDMFVPDEQGGFIKKQTGDHIPFDSRDIYYKNVIFHLSENPGEKKTYYLRLETSSSMNFPIHYRSRDALFKKTNTEQMVLGIFYGALLIMVIYNIFLYIGFRERSYVYYVLFIAVWGLDQLAINGLAFQYLWSKWIWWANVNLPFFLFATLWAANQFCRSVLETSKNAPFWDKALKYENYLYIGGIVFSLMVNYATSIRVGTAFVIITVLTIAITSYVCLRRGVRTARFFIAAWGFYMFGAILFALKSFGVLPGNMVTNWSVQVGAFALAILFSLAVQDRIKRESKEKQEAQAIALENQQKLVETLKESELILEKKVAERTKELQSSYKNVTLLAEIGQKITSTLNLEDILNMIYNNAKALMDLSIFAVGIYREETQSIDFVYYVKNSQHMRPLSVPLDSENEFSVWCIKNRKHIFSGDIEKDKGKYLSSEIELNTDEYGNSVIYLPLFVEERMIGVTTVQSFKKNAYTNYHLDILRTLVSYGAVALDNANAYQEIKKAHMELELTQTQLIHTEKMASLGQLTAGIAHEIKNPLNFVNNFAELSVELADELAEELDVNTEKSIAEIRDDLGEILTDLKQNALKINEHGRRADGIVKSMLKHARSTLGERAATDLNALLDEYVNLAFHGMRAQQEDFQCEIERNYDDTVSKIELVPQEIGRVFLNLLNNAFEAVHSQAVQNNRDYIPMVRVNTQQIEGEVKIRVLDNGVGIPAEIKDKIFEPFFTTKPTGSGTGLGLSLSYDIVTQGHGGAFTVESTEGQGTTLIITLPVSGAGEMLVNSHQLGRQI